MRPSTRTLSINASASPAPANPSKALSTNEGSFNVARPDGLDNNTIGQTTLVPHNGTDSATVVVDLGPEALRLLAAVLVELGRIADHFDPPPSDIVDTPYIARRLGCTTTWIAQMVRDGEIPQGCVVPGSGKGRQWKFYRRRIEEWLASR